MWKKALHRGDRCDRHRAKIQGNGENVKMRYGVIRLAAGVVAAACLAGCAPSEAEPSHQPEEARAVVMAADVEIKKTVLFADPAGAASAIYESLETVPVLTEVDQNTVEEVFGVESEDVEEVTAYSSDAKSGLCDVALILPKADKADEVREALMQYAALRAESFKNYDILGAYSIAQNTAVFSQGDYVVMLMLPDNDQARDILDAYMPQ